MRDLYINRDGYQYAKFCRISNFIKTSPSKASAGFNKIAKWVKGGVLMVIHIYVKVSIRQLIALTMLILSSALYAEYAIYAQVSADILWLAESGKNLKKGETLVKLDARLAQAKLDEAQAILNTRQIQFDDKKLLFGQIQQLFDNLVRSKRELDIARIEYQQAKYELEAQKNRVLQQQLWLDKYQILAPFDLQVKSAPSKRNVTNHYQPKVLLLVNPINN
ncbi:RND multidrug efflux membrane fusion protein MexE precursor [uncultured Candidatus Thioglobus sp.]|nr:RND multidrug efflux membrane fusion protein MexE precursor [uncultured Candidatus Thioglobus sp.]